MNSSVEPIGSNLKRKVFETLYLFVNFSILFIGIKFICYFYKFSNVFLKNQIFFQNQTKK